MRVSENWLRRWIKTDLTTDEILNKFTMAGIEVDSCQDISQDFPNVVIGKVNSVKKHPNADKLNICEVDVGGDQVLSIICGASNVRKDLNVIVATIGAILPGNFKIKCSKIRGVESNGMICSWSELKLAEKSPGIAELSNDAKAGQPLAEFLQLDDRVIDFDLTPNRGDCLSVLGLSRELHTLTNKAFDQDKLTAVKSTIKDQCIIDNIDANLCPLYACRIIKNIDSSAKTPIWMVESLRRSGIRAIHPIVDILNFVMLELGQPMHAFDVSKLGNCIEVRLAKDGEEIVLLDGNIIALNRANLIIASNEKPIALAGIMGGSEAAVDTTSNDILLESAFFFPDAIRTTASTLKIHTDSSHRFERGVDPTIQQIALERASQLITEITGGEVGPISVYSNKAKMPKLSTIVLRSDRVKKILGVSIPDETIKKILTNLGAELSEIKGGWEVLVPPYRLEDLRLEVDLIEEIIRIYGYDRLSKSSSLGSVPANTLNVGALIANRLADYLACQGYFEVINYSFISEKVSELMFPGNCLIKVANPISNEMSVMRASLWPGLIENLQYNLSRQHLRVKCFEIGQCFTQDGNDLNQVDYLAGIISGDFMVDQWGQKKRAVDFYDIKRDVSNLLSLVAGNDAFYFSADIEESTLHPTQKLGVFNQIDKTLVGSFGRLHPVIADKLTLKGPVYLFELIIPANYNKQVKAAKPQSRFPKIIRDLSIIVDKKVDWEDVCNKIRENKFNSLKNVVLFDIYTGEDIGLDNKVLSFRLFFQDDTKTLIDKQISLVFNKIIDIIINAFNAKMR